MTEYNTINSQHIEGDQLTSKVYRAACTGLIIFGVIVLIYGIIQYFIQHYST
jgi:hypothetical protein